MSERTGFFEETYNSSKDTFKKGLDLTGRYISYLKKIETDKEKLCKRKFRKLTNKELVARANSLPDFKWDDEDIELRCRSLLLNGAFLYRIQRNSLVIVRDEQAATPNH